MTLTRRTAAALGRGLYRLDVVGQPAVPPTGSVLLAVNHSAFVDGPLVYGLVGRPAVFLVKSEMFGGAVGAGLRRLGQIPVRRGVAERGPLLAALDTLAAGGVVGVFPEGTRGTGVVESIQHGVAYLAMRSGAPVLPVACHGTVDLLPPGRRLPRWRPRARVSFGEPIVLPASSTVSRRAVAAAAEQIRLALAAHVRATGPESPVRPARTGTGEPA